MIGGPFAHALKGRPPGASGSKHIAKKCDEQQESERDGPEETVEASLRNVLSRNGCELAQNVIERSYIRILSLAKGDNIVRSASASRADRFSERRPSAHPAQEKGIGGPGPGPGRVRQDRRRLREQSSRGARQE